MGKTFRRILIVGLLAGMPASADDGYIRKYRTHGTVANWTDMKSCGAAARMLEDRHEITVDGFTVRVDGQRWDVSVASTPDDLLISFHTGENGDQLVYLTMELRVDDRALIGQYSLWGVDEKRNRCVDRVEIRGDRI